MEITIHMKFFGAFRKFGDGLDFCVPVGSTIAAVKAALVQALGGQDQPLIEASALANDNCILRDGDVLDSDTELSILPPVCGG